MPRGGTGRPAERVIATSSTDQHVVVETSGGVVAAVYTSDPRIRVVLINWDEAEEPDGTVAGLYPIDPLDRMPEDTAREYRSVVGPGGRGNA